MRYNPNTNVSQRSDKLMIDFSNVIPLDRLKIHNKDINDFSRHFLNKLRKAKQTNVTSLRGKDEFLPPLRKNRSLLQLRAIDLNDLIRKEQDRLRLKPPSSIVFSHENSQLINFSSKIFITQNKENHSEMLTHKDHSFISRCQLRAECNLPFLQENHLTCLQNIKSASTIETSPKLPPIRMPPKPIYLLRHERNNRNGSPLKLKPKS